MPGIQEEQYQYLQELSNKITDELHEILLKVYYEMIEEVEVNNESNEKPIDDEEEILWITTHSEINWEEIRVTWNEDFEEFLKQHICQKCGVSAQVKDLENWENNGMKCQYCIMNIEAERITDIYEEANMKYERCIKCNRKSMCYDKICKGCDSYNIGKCEYCYKEQVKVIKTWELFHKWNSTCSIMKGRCNINDKHHVIMKGRCNINEKHHAHDLCRECEYRYQIQQQKQVIEKKK